MKSLDELLDHLAEFANAVDADLEQGSHDWNNLAAEDFCKTYPQITAWSKKMADLRREVEDQLTILERY